MTTFAVCDALGRPVVRVTRNEGGYAVEAVGVLTAFVDREGRVTSTQVQCDIHPLDVPEILEQAVAPRLGQLVGRPSLHASAIELEGKAVAFQGPSGSGKSTLAALMVQHGARLLTDDALTLDPGPTGCLARPFRPFSRLTPDSAAALGDTLGPGSRGSEKFSFDLPAAQTAAPLARIYVLDGKTPTPTIEPLRQRDAVLELAKHLHRIDPNDPRLLALELEFLGTVAGTVRVARLSHPRRFDERAALVDAIVQDLGATP